MKRHTWGFVVLGVCTGATCGTASELGHLRAENAGDLSYAAVPFETFDHAQVTACGAGGPNAAGEAGFHRWPYLQKVTTDAAEVLFTSDAEGEFVVEVTRPDGTSVTRQTAKADHDVTPSRGTQFVAALSGLPAGEMLCYRVLAGDKAWTEPTGFRLAPSPDTTEPVRIAAFGDVGTRTADQYAVLDQLESVPMDLALLTGDIAYDNGKPREIDDNLFGVYEEMMGTVPFFVASGNHEYNTDDARPFREAFSLFENGGELGRERWYSFDWGPVHVVVLDTERYFDEQKTWLQKDLESSDRPWTIAMLHRPPYSSGEHGSDLKVREAFGPIFSAYGVPLVLAGHEHDYERTEPQDGVIYVVTGGGGRGTRPVGEEDFTAVSDQVAHFVWIEADPDKIRLVAIDATGEAFDSVLIE